jgi:hypothetical protein
VQTDPGRFYGPATDLPVGAGIVLSSCPFALTHESEIKYETALGYTLVLTHECDIDSANNRSFNTHLLVAPIIPFEDFVVEYGNTFGAGLLNSFIPQMASGKVSRVFYIPPLFATQHDGHLENGGVIYLNQITTCEISWLNRAGAVSVCSLSSFGITALDYKLENHLRRPKSISLWFQR